MSRLFRSKPGFKVSDSGGGKSEITVSLPAEEDGLTSRFCPRKDCEPRYFKIKTGTGLSSPAELELRCPYCGTGDSGQAFHTPAQVNYVEALVAQQMEEAFGDMFRDAFGGRTRFGGGMLTLEVEFRRESLPFVPKPEEGWVRRQLTCKNCSLVHAVYGLSLWCPDCGSPTFPIHIEDHVAKLTAMLSDIPRREKHLGSEVAQSDLDNILEDIVAFYEGSLKYLDQRACECSQAAKDLAPTNKRKSGLFQRFLESLGTLKTEHGFHWQAVMSEKDAGRLDRLFQSRHAITHNLGVADAKFVEKTGMARMKGRDIRILQQDIDFSLSLVAKIVHAVHEHLFGSGKLRPATQDIMQADKPLLDRNEIGDDGDTQI